MSGNARAPLSWKEKPESGEAARVGMHRKCSGCLAHSSARALGIKAVTPCWTLPTPGKLSRTVLCKVLQVNYKTTCVARHPLLCLSNAVTL